MIWARRIQRCCLIWCRPSKRILESTYGGRRHEDRAHRRERLSSEHRHHKTVQHYLRSRSLVGEFIVKQEAMKGQMVCGNSKR